MDWDKKGKELYDEFVKPYRSVSREITFIEELHPRIGGSEIKKLTDYQEELLFHLHEGNNVVVYKTRQCGYTTVLMLHVLFLMHEEFCKNGFKCVSNVLFVEPTANCKEDIKKKLREIIETTPLNYSSGFAKEIEKHVTITTYDRIDKLCGKVFNYAIYDEFAFANQTDFKNMFQSVYGSMLGYVDTKEHAAPTGTSVLVSSFNEENEEKTKRDVEKLMEKISNTVFMQTHWYEVSTLNKNLVWKKYEVEPTIDAEGNVRYDRERWEQRIADGWIPTSPKYEKMCELLGENKAKIELLN